MSPPPPGSLGPGQGAGNLGGGLTNLRLCDRRCTDPRLVRELGIYKYAKTP